MLGDRTPGHEDLARTGDGTGDLHHLQDVDVSVLVESDSE